MDVFIWTIPFFWHFQRFAGYHWGKEAFKWVVQLHQISFCMICFLFGKTFPPGWIAVNLKGISSFISCPCPLKSQWPGEEKAFFPPENCLAGDLLGILYQHSFPCVCNLPVCIFTRERILSTFLNWDVPFPGTSFQQEAGKILHPNGSELEADIHCFKTEKWSFKSFIIWLVVIKQEYFSWENELLLLTHMGWVRRFPIPFSSLQGCSPFQHRLWGTGNDCRSGILGNIYIYLLPLQIWECVEFRYQ